MNRALLWEVMLKTNFTLEKLWKLVNWKILWGEILWGIDDNICEEIPTIYNTNYLWMRILLYGEPCMSSEYAYSLSFYQNFNFKENINITEFLIALCKEKLECDEIKILSEEEVKI